MTFASVAPRSTYASSHDSKIMHDVADQFNRSGSENFLAIGGDMSKLFCFFVMLTILMCNRCFAENLKEKSDGAYKDYMLHCSGCHKFDGSGVVNKGVPSFINSINYIASIPEGRKYLIEVPGASQSKLNDSELADVLNWIIDRYGSKEIFVEPFNESEVSLNRYTKLNDVKIERKKIEKILLEKQITISPYFYGE